MERKNNSGAIFKNDRKTESKHPDAKGDCVIDGVEYWVSAWVKDGQKGKFTSLSFTKKEAMPDNAAPIAISAEPQDLPF